MTDSPSLLIRTSPNGVMHARLNRPEVLNAIDHSMHQEIAGLWERADADDAVRVVLLTAEGRSFSAGGHNSFARLVQQDQAVRLSAMREVDKIAYGLINMRKPVVAAIQGHAIGAGLAVALLADVSVAADNAQIIDGHVTAGLVPGDHAVMLWPQLCGLARAKYHLMTGAPLTGAEAAAFGLVSLAVPADQLESTAEAIADRLAQANPLALELTKRALNGWLTMAKPIFDSALAMQMLLFAEGIGGNQPGNAPPEASGGADGPGRS
jgi:enoyl-CoA hydratase